MKNILVTNISTLNEEKKEYTYEVHVSECTKREIKAYHTNESILRCVSELRSVKEHKEHRGIDLIIALVSNKSKTNTENDFGKTAKDYYDNVALEILPDVEIDHIDIEDEKNTPRPMAYILSEICGKIDSGDTVYIDSAGGMRTITNIVQILTNILRYKGIQNPYTLYANIQNGAYIEDTFEFTRMSMLAEAFNEFMTTGKADQLKDAFEINIGQKEPYESLLGAMVDFSDCIRLGNIAALDEIIPRLTKSIQPCLEDSDMDDVAKVIVRQFLPIIKEKLIGDEKNEIDYVRIIEWCLDNMLIQQAVTLFVEKIPVYLFDKKVISCNIVKAKEEYKQSKNPLAASDWETYAFFTDLLQLNNSDVTELKELLSDKKRSNEVSDKVRDIYTVLQSFEENYPNSKDKSDVAKRIKEILDVTPRPNTYGKFINKLKNEDTTLAKILGENNESSGGAENTLTRKFKAIQKFENDGKVNSKYRINVKIDKCASIYYAYMYAKALRNKINHASSDENLDKCKKEILEKKYQYDFSKENLTTICKNLHLALNSVKESVKEAESSLLPIVHSTPNVNKVIYHTDCSIGDVVKATVVGRKKVVLDGYDYEVQLVIPKSYTQSLKTGQELSVVVKQISKAEQIMQVSL